MSRIWGLGVRTHAQPPNPVVHHGDPNELYYCSCRVKTLPGSSSYSYRAECSSIGRHTCPNIQVRTCPFGRCVLAPVLVHYTKIYPESRSHFVSHTKLGVLQRQRTPFRNDSSIK